MGNDFLPEEENTSPTENTCEEQMSPDEQPVEDEREIAEDARAEEPFPVVEYPNLSFDDGEPLQIHDGKLQESNEEPYKFYLEYSGHGDTFLIDGPFENKDEAELAHGNLDMSVDWKRDCLWIKKSAVIIPFDREEARRKITAMRPAKSVTFDYDTPEELRVKLAGAMNDMMGLSLNNSTCASGANVKEDPKILQEINEKVSTLHSGMTKAMREDLLGPPDPIEVTDVPTYPSITEILELCGNRAAELETILDPVLDPPTGPTDPVGDYGAVSKCQAMLIYNILGNILGRLAL